MTYVIKRGDSYPPFEKQLRKVNSLTLDLSSVSDVTFNMRDEEYNVVISDNTSGRVSIVDAPKGVVQYDWRSSDTSDIGSYEAEFVVDFGTDGEQTFPVGSNYEIEIIEDIND